MSMILALCNRVAAANGDAKSIQQLLDSLQVFEANVQLGGNMGHYRVNANTSAHDVVRGIMNDTPFVSVRDRYLTHPHTQSELIPLEKIESLMVEPLAQSMHEFLGNRLHCGIEVTRIDITDNGFASYDGNNQLRAISQNLLLCCGGSEFPLTELNPLGESWEGSGRFLLRDDLEGLPAKEGKIVIIGASHSAFSCAWRLLYDPLFAEYARGREIVILQRRGRIKLRCTTEFAATHNIDYDPKTDLCPFTGLVFRNGGLRKDAKKLYLKIRDGQENRVKLLKMKTLDEKRELLEQAGLILQATGFVANLPRIERNGSPLAIGNPTQSGQLRELDTDRIIPGLFGMGLGLNILPDGNPSGEPSFDGGIHGFQSYPLSIAPGIIDRLVANLPAEERH